MCLLSTSILGQHCSVLDDVRGRSFGLTMAHATYFLPLTNCAQHGIIVQNQTVKKSGVVDWIFDLSKPACTPVLQPIALQRLKWIHDICFPCFSGRTRAATWTSRRIRRVST